MQALSIRIAKRLNALWERTGALFADRYHDRVLKTPREVRNALSYVLNNALHHGVHYREAVMDGYSSARSFNGFSDAEPLSDRATNGAASHARTWLLDVGWQRAGGLISLFRVP